MKKGFILSGLLLMAILINAQTNVAVKTAPDEFTVKYENYLKEYKEYRVVRKALNLNKEQFLKLASNYKPGDEIAFGISQDKITAFTKETSEAAKAYHEVKQILGYKERIIEYENAADPECNLGCRAACSFEKDACCEEQCVCVMQTWCFAFCQEQYEDCLCDNCNCNC